MFKKATVSARFAAIVRAIGDGSSPSVSYVDFWVGIAIGMLATEAAPPIQWIAIALGLRGPLFQAYLQ
jgi:hypothetical protein